MQEEKNTFEILNPEVSKMIMDWRAGVFKKKFGKFWCVYRCDESNAIGVFDHEQDANNFLAKSI